jgi:hypothetical protein
MSRWTLIACMMLAVTGCEKDPVEPCQLAYNRLIRLAKHRGDEEQRARFVQACIQAWDAGRHGCLMKAKNPSEALACRPTKVRPG